MSVTYTYTAVPEAGAWQLLGVVAIGVIAWNVWRRNPCVSRLAPYAVKGRD
jgi:hypothetical protein